MKRIEEKEIKIGLKKKKGVNGGRGLKCVSS